MIKGLGALPYYYFKDSDKSITDLDGLRSIPSKEVKAELESGYLRDWLTTFFQENPLKNLFSPIRIRAGNGEISRIHRKNR